MYLILNQMYLIFLKIQKKRKNFCGSGERFFCEWHHKWRTFRPPCPISPSLGPKPLDGSILLKLLLENRLQSESFELW